MGPAGGARGAAGELGLGRLRPFGCSLTGRTACTGRSRQPGSAASADCSSPGGRMASGTAPEHPGPASPGCRGLGYTWRGQRHHGSWRGLGPPRPDRVTRARHGPARTAHTGARSVRGRVPTAHWTPALARCNQPSRSRLPSSWRRVDAPAGVVLRARAPPGRQDLLRPWP